MRYNRTQQAQRVRQRDDRALNLAVAKRFCAKLGHHNVTRKQAADILEDHLGWPHDYSKPSTKRIAVAVDQIIYNGGGA